MGSSSPSEMYRFDSFGGPSYRADPEFLICEDCTLDASEFSVHEPDGSLVMACPSCAEFRARENLHRVPLVDDRATESAREILRQLARVRVAAWRRAQARRSRELNSVIRNIAGI